MIRVRYMNGNITLDYICMDRSIYRGCVIQREIVSGDRLAEWVGIMIGHL